MGRAGIWGDYLIGHLLSLTGSTQKDNLIYVIQYLYKQCISSKANSAGLLVITYYCFNHYLLFTEVQKNLNCFNLDFA